ncbi:ABC transporter ATP-binding protein [Microbacterium sp. 18062]|uniref:ABC transporter ATP-binding protein n=1 Tax=Microbacterium sp. 18062 TaxID=2681410 RepID=UPI00135BF4EB|nr:ABC transporter ATP-binding protein [Microbacterium sp. 18062]
MDVIFDAIGKSYQTRSGRPVRAVAHVDLAIPHGTFVSLVGPSGCGKTTLLDILLGVTAPTTGRVLLDGRDQHDGAETSAERPAVVLQAPTLLPWRTVRSNVTLLAACGPAAMRRPRPVRNEVRARADALLDLVGVGDFADRYPSELSGGMQQRVAIARALFTRSPLMCFDEPFSALDEFTRESLHDELQRIWSTEGFTAVFVTHNIQEAVLLSDRVIVMAPRPGRVVADISIDLPRPRLHERMTDPAFGDLVLRIREALREGLVEAA